MKNLETKLVNNTSNSPKCAENTCAATTAVPANAGSNNLPKKVRRRVKVSRVGDSIGGARLHSAYDQHKEWHERNQEALKELFEKLDAKRELKFYTYICGEREWIPMDKALSFALNEHVVIAVLHLKAQNPTVSMGLEEFKKTYCKEIILYILQNLAEKYRTVKKSGSLYIV